MNSNYNYYPDYRHEHNSFPDFPEKRHSSPERNRRRSVTIHTIVIITRRTYQYILDDLNEHDDYPQMYPGYRSYRRPEYERRAQDPVNADHKKDEGGFQKNARWN